MCKPTSHRPIQNVIVAGAGPAGLLLSSLLLKRNEASDDALVRYNVTLVDAGEDYGALDPAQLKMHRSWMIGLAGHGLAALRTIPELYDEYVADVGVRLKSFSIHLGSKEMKTAAPNEGEDDEAYIVDRNYICASIARYLKNRHGSDPAFDAVYHTKLQYVDGDNKRVLVRGADGKNERYIDYDLLVGCDGVRSRVRDAIGHKHKDFECEVGDIFQEFKAVHVECPPEVAPTGMHLLPACLPQMQGIALPEKGNMLNVSFGVPRHSFDEMPEGMKSDDPVVVARYLKQNFKAFNFVDYDDFARQWVAQRWNRTGMVHANFYHSLPQNIVIMGDAAHATSPSIGMGMNTALRDAAEFVRLLGEHADKVEDTLPAFSKERVKEGNSLPDLALHLYCLDETAQLVETVHMIIRSKLASWFPRLVAEHPQTMIGRNGVPLSNVYDLAVRQGIVTKHRAINDKIRRDHFEKTTGMVKKVDKKRFGAMGYLSAAAVVAGVAVGAGKTYL